MGVLKFPDRFRSDSTRSQRTQGEDVHPNAYGEATTEVPGPGAAHTSRNRKRLSPAAVIAKSLAPDAQNLSPTDIIARSVESAFGGPTFSPPPVRPSEPRRPAPTHYTEQFRAFQPTPSPQHSPSPFADFWNVWLEHHDYLFKQSLRFMAGNMADAEDALSHAMLKGSQHFDADTIRNERAWLTRLVHNSCMDQHRSRKRQARLSDEIDGDDPEQAPNITPQPERTPDEALHMRQIFDQLEHHMKQLPISLLEPLLMRVVEDRSYDDIAAHMGLSNCAVRKRIQLARDRLRDAGVL